MIGEEKNIKESRPREHPFQKDTTSLEEGFEKICEEKGVVVMGRVFPYYISEDYEPDENDRVKRMLRKAGKFTKRKLKEGFESLERRRQEAKERERAYKKAYRRERLKAVRKKARRDARRDTFRKSHFGVGLNLDRVDEILLGPSKKKKKRNVHWF